MEHTTQNNYFREQEDTGFNLPQHLKEDTPNASLYQQLADQGFSHVLHELFIKRNLGYTEFDIPLKLCDRKYPSQESEITELNLHFSLDRQTGKCSFEHFTADRLAPGGRLLHQTFAPEFSAIETISLMAGRALYRDHLQGENSASGWVQLDFSSKDGKGNYSYKYFPEQSFDLDKELKKLPLNEALFSFNNRYETASKMLKHGEVVEIQFERPQGNLLDGEQVCFTEQKKDECGDTIYGHLVRRKPTANHPEGLATVEDRSGRIHHVSLDILQRPPECFYLITNPRQQQIDILNSDWKLIPASELTAKYPCNVNGHCSGENLEANKGNVQDLVVHVNRGEYGYTITEMDNPVLWGKINDHVVHDSIDQDEMVFLESLKNFNLESIDSPEVCATCFEKGTIQSYIQKFLENGITVNYRGENITNIEDMQRIDDSLLVPVIRINGTTANDAEETMPQKVAGVRM